jgi:phosphate:Na+ symporter
MESPQGLVGVVFWLLGGLALFLYGIEVMGTALRKAAGSALRNGLSRLTRTRFHGLCTGALFTALWQSSSATTVMVVGFISAGLLEFSNSVGMIIGANVGTTITPYIAAFKTSDLALPMLGVGFVLNFATKKRLLRQLGLAAMGFGMLFLGLELMKSAIGAHRDTIEGWLKLYTSGGLLGQLLAFLTALVVTAIIQSSSATVSLIVQLAVAGTVQDIRIVLPMILGADIGTCVTAMLASLRASKSARRAAVAHLAFNVIGSLLTVILYHGYVRIVPMISSTPALMVANCHLAIKLVNGLLVLPFTTHLARLIQWLVPGKDKLNAAPEFLDYDVMDQPEKALECVTREIRRMCELGVTLMDDAVDSLLKQDEALQAEVLEQEALVDDLCTSVTDYILTLSGKELPGALSGHPALLLHIMSDVERLGDHAENIAELAQTYARMKKAFSEAAVSDLVELRTSLHALATLTLEALDHMGRDRTNEAASLRGVVLEQFGMCRSRHTQRLEDGRCTPLAGIVFDNLITNLRSVATHLEHIARATARG